MSVSPTTKSTPSPTAKRRACRPAHGNVEGVGAHDLELETVFGCPEIQRSAVRVADVLGLEQNLLHQPVVVALGRQRDPHLDQTLKVQLAGFLVHFLTGHIVRHRLPRQNAPRMAPATVINLLAARNMLPETIEAAKRKIALKCA